MIFYDNNYQRLIGDRTLKHLTQQKERGEAEISVLIRIVFSIFCFAAWFPHLYVFFTTKKWGFLIAGVIFFSNRNCTWSKNLAKNLVNLVQ